jgi:hypothetical protein
VRLVAEAIALRRRVGDRGDLAVSLELLGTLLAAGHPWLATTLIAAAGALRSRYPLGEPGDRADREATVAALRSALDEVTFREAWTAGEAAQLDLVIDEALLLVRQQTGTSSQSVADQVQ